MTATDRVILGGAAPGRAAVWPHRLAGLTLVATALLIVVGGLVTNTGAALAVPDWPTTFGRNMFLFPWSEMVGGVLYEHSHRLLGALVGALTLALAASVWGTGLPGPIRAAAAMAVVAVVLQGVLGGLRVVLLRDALAIVHGCLAQAYFALVVALWVLTSPAWQREVRPLPDAAGRWLPWMAVAVAAAVYGQIVLGALTTHAGWVNLHLAGAAVVMLAIGGLVSRVETRHRDRPELLGPARVIGGLLVGQLALGLGAYVARFTGIALPGGALAVLALPVAHRLTGALLVGAAVALALWGWRLRRTPIEASTPLRRRVTSSRVAA